ncbi:hypothetical protein M430DRAFT_43241 [Amorphotheca resinae ATCC 22711]|uniref:NADH dehydrogenase [ubiquinone] 1 beta subcomplex subunit 11, mitochondrial n=1 Tax=Amorphotheca resinae ATCC 22711 TaxID=857342 RepID=A0A2T3AY22_AMORE|nr:hypothetical protein M430DRAFT_43241 [Amorphotheca resinae ATCC 22711]PSS14964.1 hypothetical protein M430DRAFT_43241 [Amorphotheca resinae ATCC 22711]
MPHIRPLTSRSTAALLHRTSPINRAAAPINRTAAPVGRLAPFSTTRRIQAAAHEEDHYDAPGGWLWGLDPSKKHEKEGWENIFVWGFFGSLGLGVVAYAFKPDTSIQTWALEEARRRLEVEGILKEPESK